MKSLIAFPAAARNVALLIARVILGTVLIAHGVQKFSEWTLAGTGAAFEQMGVPAPQLSATVAAFVELVGGLLLLVGAFSAIAGLIVAVEMAGAAVLVHLSGGVFVAANGWELVGVIAAAALAVGVAGAGRYSVDAMILSRSAGVAAETREPQPVGN
ncbi:DoxX family protein [Tessaracoccus sp. MC1756]|uniref:DoxX family protein n=1 Tax=Tessaracoccus sp. MC1756 TaxID=2760311 RepID=UPI00160435CB|nr:DoxX family protein [Tessaracoccus sp. MC1756]MBB1509027.1 DoxX family protein [Tessaracoccus sp. MC1756]